MPPILHLSLAVTDLPAAVAFYRDVLGCPVGRRRDGWTDVWFFGLQLTLQERPDAHHFGVAVDEATFDTIGARLAAAGITIDPAGTSDEQRKAKFVDPSGNVIEIKTYRDVGTSLGRPLFVVVDGPPASGKSTLAPAIAERLALPLVAKDTIRDTVAMLAVAAASPVGAVIESNLYRSAAVETLGALPGVVVEVSCRVGRTEDTREPVAGGWPVIEVDTAAPVDFDRVVAEIVAATQEER